jgi:hypothetical protein
MVVDCACTSIVNQVAGFEAKFKELSAAGGEKIFLEQVSSITLRVQLQLALEFVRGGDVFVVTKLDRLARSVGDLMALFRCRSVRLSPRVFSILAWIPNRLPAS